MLIKTKRNGKDIVFPLDSCSWGLSDTIDKKYTAEAATNLLLSSVIRAVRLVEAHHMEHGAVTIGTINKIIREQVLPNIEKVRDKKSLISRKLIINQTTSILTNAIGVIISEIPDNS